MNKSIKILLKTVAVIIPFYFVYYPALHEDINNPEVKSLWRFTLLGFLAYFMGALLVGLNCLAL